MVDEREKKIKTPKHSGVNTIAGTCEKLPPLAWTTTGKKLENHWSKKKGK